MKAVRITTRSGLVRITSLPKECSMESWWFACKGLGEVVGNHWCMPFDTIAVADMIEISDPNGKPEMISDHQEALGRAIASGSFKPDFKA